MTQDFYVKLKDFTMYVLVLKTWDLCCIHWCALLNLAEFLKLAAATPRCLFFKHSRTIPKNFATFKKLEALGKVHVGGTPLFVSSYLQQDYQGVLHCVDNLEHKHTTANKVLSAVEKLDLFDFLEFRVDDAFKLAEKISEDSFFDLLWLDFGAGERMAAFFDQWWPRVSPTGGMVLVHSTLTNRQTREWLEGMKGHVVREEDGKYGVYGLMSLLEPHKLFQNSFSMFQKRENYSEPIYSLYP